jgi:hypothetical protein
MARKPWTSDEEAALAGLVARYPTLGPHAYRAMLEAAGYARTYLAVFEKLDRMGLGSGKRAATAATERHEAQLAEHRPDLLAQTGNKVDVSFNWRHANGVIGQMQELAIKANPTQHESRFGVPDATGPIVVVGLGDTHIGDWATDHALLESITDELLNIPHLYIILMGDLVQMAIKLRNVAEVSSNMLPPELQMAYLDSWLAEIAPRVILACDGNHEERQQVQAGVSLTRHLISKHITYADGIAHADIQVGQQVYTFAVSHVFRGKSMYSPVHGQARYLRMVGQDREIAFAGDSHTPGFAMYNEGGRWRCAINGGSIQASPYMRRHFQLTNDPSYPCIMLFPSEHRFVPFRTVADCLAASKGIAS